mgnify:CR=1 FL=1
MYNNSKEVKESWILAKKAYDLIIDYPISEQTDSQLFDRDVETIKRGVYKIFTREEQLSGFRLAHRVDRGFLNNFFTVLSWQFDAHKALPTAAQNVSECEKASDTNNQNICLISSMVTYGKGMLESMESTFTNPFEIQMSNVIFGLDTISLKKHRYRRMEVIVGDNTNEKNVVTIPKYDNYMRNHNSWNTIKLHLFDLQPDSNYRIQYTTYNLRKEKIDLAIHFRGDPRSILLMYLSGAKKRISYGEYYIVTEANAHTWVEVFFPEYGWITFDPTPPSLSESYFSTAFTNLGLWLDSMKLQWYKWVVFYNLDRQVLLYTGLWNAILPDSKNIDLGTRCLLYTSDAADE